jgi:hypothetical protein
MNRRCLKSEDKVLVSDFPPPYIHSEVAVDVSKDCKRPFEWSIL